MWRVDNRKLPPDIVVDGGSDWIAIHRNYSHYLVTDQSRYLTGLKRYYEFSLLPAEVRGRWWQLAVAVNNGPLTVEYYS